MISLVRMPMTSSAKSSKLKADEHEQDCGVINLKPDGILVAEHIVGTVAKVTEESTEQQDPSEVMNHTVSLHTQNDDISTEIERKTVITISDLNDFGKTNEPAINKIAPDVEQGRFVCGDLSFHIVETMTGDATSAFVTIGVPTDTCQGDISNVNVEHGIAVSEDQAETRDLDSTTNIVQQGRTEGGIIESLSEDVSESAANEFENVLDEEHLSAVGDIGGVVGGKDCVCESEGDDQEGACVAIDVIADPEPVTIDVPVVANSVELPNIQEENQRIEGNGALEVQDEALTRTDIAIDTNTKIVEETEDPAGDELILTLGEAKQTTQIIDIDGQDTTSDVDNGKDLVAIDIRDSAVELSPEIEAPPLATCSEEVHIDGAPKSSTIDAETPDDNTAQRSVHDQDDKDGVVAENDDFGIVDLFSTCTSGEDSEHAATRSGVSGNEVLYSGTAEKSTTPGTTSPIMKGSPSSTASKTDDKAQLQDDSMTNLPTTNTTAHNDFATSPTSHEDTFKCECELTVSANRDVVPTNPTDITKSPAASASSTSISPPNRAYDDAKTEDDIHQDLALRLTCLDNPLTPLSTLLNLHNHLQILLAQKWYILSTSAPTLTKRYHSPELAYQKCVLETCDMVYVKYRRSGYGRVATSMWGGGDADADADDVRDDKYILRSSVLTAKAAGSKCIKVRYTTDEWKTFTDVTATLKPDLDK
ncbi:hypothetical protein HK102_001943 [Quaeritorhiza haematococci]|nr:hypothetical protein HK102_001943 [Quaeritorhiza haematococci]